MVRTSHAILMAALICSLAVVIGCHTSERPLTAEDGDWLQRNRDKIVEEDGDDSGEPILPFTHLAAGQLFEKQNQLGKAMLQYRKAIVGSPEFVPAYNRLGICLNKTGQYQEADACFREAIRLAPDQPSLYNNLAFSLMLQKRWADAEAELQQAARLSPGYERVHMNLAIVMVKQGRYDAAFTQFQSVLGDAMAHYNMGMMYKAQGLTRQAHDSFQRALDLDPELAQARAQLTEGLAAAGIRKPVPAPEAEPPAALAVRSIVPAARVAPPVAPGSLAAAPKAAPAVVSAVRQPTPSPAPQSGVAVLQAVPIAPPVTAAAPTATADLRPVEPAKAVVADADWEVLKHYAVPTNPAALASPLTPPTAPVAVTMAKPAPKRGPAAASPPRPVQRVVQPQVDVAALEAAGLDVNLGVLAGEQVAFPRSEPSAYELVSGRPVALQNEPCEPQFLERQMAVITERLRPCKEGDYVDQFVFGPSGYEQDALFAGHTGDRPATGGPPRQRPNAPAKPHAELPLDIQDQLPGSYNHYWNQVSDSPADPSR